MTIVKCHECGAEVSDTAQACPKCGAKPKKKTSLAAKATLIVVGAVVVGSFLNKGPGDHSASAGTSASANASSNTNSAAPAPQAQAPKPTRSPGKAVAALVKTTDKVEKINFYTDKSTPRSNRANNVSIYIGDSGDQPWLRISFNYAGENWLFIRKATIVIDGEKVGEVTGSWKRDNDSSVWEWLDMSVDKSTLAVIRAMANSKNVLVRYEGQQYIKDHKLSKQELQAIRNVLAAYAELGGA